MRHFPRTARRRSVSASVAVALALGALTLPSSTAIADDLKDKQKKVEKKLDHAQDDLHASSSRLRKAQARLDAAQAELDSAQAALATAQAKVSAAQDEDARMQRALEKAEGELEAAEADLAEGQVAREEQRQVVADSVLRVYMEGDPELVAFASILEAQSTDDLTRRTELRDVVVDRENRNYDELRAAEVLLEVREKQVAQARDDVAEQRAAAADHLEYTRGVEREREAAAAAVRTKVEARAGARGAARRAKAADLAVLRQLEREQDRIEEMLRRRAQKAGQKGGGGSPSNALSNPVPGGYVTSSYGYRKHPIYGYWGLHDGTDFGGGCGKPLVAAADGTVLQSYWSDVYGNRLVVDHGYLGGASLASIYNHATRYTVRPGARVKRGQVIGYMGSTGWSTGCHLHYTVMANGRTTNPMKYL